MVLLMHESIVSHFRPHYLQHEESSRVYHTTMYCFHIAFQSYSIASKVYNCIYQASSINNTMGHLHLVFLSDTCTSATKLFVRIFVNLSKNDKDIHFLGRKTTK